MPEKSTRVGVRDGYVVGAYAASPAHSTWDEPAETEFYRQLAELPLIAALELPWLGRLHPHDDDWLLANYPQHWDAVLTDIPHTMGRVSADPHYGLASSRPGGRARALDDLRALRDDLRRLNDRHGRRVVAAVQIHSAPRGAAADGYAFTESLADLAQWEWDGADLVIEHCDAWNPAHPPQKGFLSLDDEMVAVAAAGVDVGISINWARSVIETRDPRTATAHLAAASARGLLRGFIASGVAASDSDFGVAWTDAHLPLASHFDLRYGDETSLLTRQRLGEALDAAQDANWVGVKVGCAHATTSVTDRVELIAETLTVVSDVLRARPEDATARQTVGTSA